ncbi:DUF4440 domain-containing protein [Hasllibacter sp. MH4015]|uniref:YybH family protein n=1 Tax=Hasllibacter sp. MH4015 TaxID=2854029 RepID=UPI001CD2C261|nr:nuclear transport factor 2 family protein [Hasllibacter sp. MH4015]
MRALIFALALLLPLAAQAQTNDTSNPIIARMAQLVAAYNAQDLAAIGAIYAEDAALFPPGEAAILGREAIVQHYADAIASGARDVQFMTFDIRSTDATAVEVGETVLQAGENRVVTRYMHLWEVIDGQILLTRDMYHVLSIQ